MHKRIKASLVIVTLLNLPLISYANGNATINNSSNQSVVIGFIPDVSWSSDLGNIYFYDISPSQCPGSTIDNGIPKNGPCTILAGQKVTIHYTDDMSRGGGFISNNNFAYTFSYLTNGEDPCPTLSWNHGILPGVEINSSSLGSITITENN